MIRDRWNESSTVQSFQTRGHTPKGPGTVMNRAKPIDPFMQFIMDNSRTCKGLTMYEAAKQTGINNQTLYAYANRGIKDFEVMQDLAIAFDLDMNVFLSYISGRISKRYSEKAHTKISA